MVGESPSPNSGVASFTCQGCGAAVEIRAKGLTVTAVCSACGSISENDNGLFKIVQKAEGLLKIKSRIALGTKGKLFGQIYQVIGFMQRYDEVYPEDPWDEYLLYNPYLGYCWLAESDGHWTQYKPTKTTPKPLAGDFQFLNETYKVYHRGKAVVAFVIGEFYWQVRLDQKVDTLDAICPPHSLSREASSDEVVWSLGTYVEAKTIEDAFHPNPMPRQHGVAPNQPAPTQGLGGVWMVWAWTLILLFCVQLFLGGVRSQKPIIGLDVNATVPGASDVEVATFTTQGSATHVTIDVSANVNQSWATVGLRVVPEEGSKGPEHNFEKDISYYSGYDSDGSWSEGSTSAEFLINSLPAGKYRVLISGTPDPGHSVVISSKIIIAPSVWSNFWLALFLISLPPIWLGLRSRGFERSRWSNSEYNPYPQATGGSSDDD